MPRFEIDRKLPPCVVDQGLLRELEVYLREHAPDLSDRADETFTFALKIEDSFGTETLASAEELRHSFCDSTRTVTMRFHGLIPSVSIRFSKDALASNVAVEATGPKARESATGVYSGIIRIIELKKSGARFFHPFNSTSS
jgi:hypothetical protein